VLSAHSVLDYLSQQRRNSGCSIASAVAKGLKVTLVIEPASIPNIDSTGMKKVTASSETA